MRLPCPVCRQDLLIVGTAKAGSLPPCVQCDGCRAILDVVESGARATLIPSQKCVRDLLAKVETLQTAVDGAYRACMLDGSTWEDLYEQRRRALTAVCAVATKAGA